jgi:hypothetical protein
MGGLITGLIAMFPRYFDITIVPNELYGLKIEQRDEIIDKLLQTYLVQENTLLLRAGEKPFFLKVIAILMIGSIAAFLIVIVTIMVDLSSSTVYIIITVSLIVLVIVLYMILTNIREYKKRRIDIKKQLEE